MNRLQRLVIGLGAGALCSCTVNDSPDYSQYEAYNYSELQYSQTYDVNPDNYSQYPITGSGMVTVPESYHVGAYHSPTRAKDRDRNWVSNQNPQGYTIEIANDQKAAKVASKLYRAPKNDRMAEIKYQQNGSTYYKGLYGSYNSYEDAQKALNALPEDLKQGAGIKNWGSVQSNMAN